MTAAPVRLGGGVEIPGAGALVLYLMTKHQVTAFFFSALNILAILVS